MRDDKKRNCYLITIKGNKKVHLKKFRQQNGTRALSFASEEDWMRVLGLTPGSVNPMGLLNDENHIVQFYIDASFMDDPGLIGVHPNDNTATVWMKTKDLIRILKEHQVFVHVEEM